MLYRVVDMKKVNTLIDVCEENNIDWDIWDYAENVEFGVDNEDNWKMLEPYL